MKIIIWIILLIAASKVWGTEPQVWTNQSIHAGIGYLSHYFIDHHSSPLRYSNKTLMYTLQYTHEGRRGRHRIVFGYDGGEFNTPGAEPGGMYEDYYRLYFEGGYVHHLTSYFNDRLRILGGFYFDNILTYREHFYFEDRSDIYIEFISAFHPAIEIYYRIGNQHRIRSRVGVSPVAYIYHSPYSIRGSAQNTFEFFESFRKMGVMISYQRIFSERLQTELFYTLNYYRHRVPRLARFASENIIIQFGYRL